MKLRNWLLLIGILWHHQDLDGAPAAPFQGSQPLPNPLDTSDKAAIAQLKREAALENKGSAAGSADFFHHIKKSIGNTIKNKIGQLAKSSAGASAYFSHSSSGQHGHGHGYGGYGPGIGHVHAPVHVPYTPYIPHHVDDDHYSEVTKPFDFWSLKKSVLYTLLQAVKAIKGGVIAIKGQLIKGGGHLLTAKGKLIRGGGEALTSIGKNIAASAFMWVPDSHEVEHAHHIEHDVHHAEHYDHGVVGGGGGFSALSGPASLHSVSAVSGPGGPSPHYGVPSGLGAGPPSGGGAYYYHNSVIPDARRQPQQPDGLIVLRKIPKSVDSSDSDVDHTTHMHSGSIIGQESQKTPSFQPLSDALVPKLRTLLNSIPKDHESEKPQSPSTPLGPLMGYLEYIREQSRKAQGTQPSVEVSNTKSSLFVTPAPSETNPHEILKAQTASLHKHLLELHEMQQLQHAQQRGHLTQLYSGQNVDDTNPFLIDVPAEVDPYHIDHLPQGQTDTSTNPFVIHYPDYEIGNKLEGRAPTRKRHTAQRVSANFKLKRLQQIHNMQRQLLREVRKVNAPPRSRAHKIPNVDVVRSIEFLH